MEIPEKLYKYEPFTDLTLRNLKRQSIYFSSPNGFNDPYDCAITPSIQELSIEQINILRQYYQNYEEIADDFKKEIEKFPNDAFVKLISGVVADAFLKQTKKFRTTNGITCLCETNDDLLMWAHYGGKYKGFCLEFNTMYEPFNNASKVRYSDSIPKIDPIPCIINDDVEQFIDLFCLKSKSWEYEREWRILHQNACTPFIYPSEALTGIYFGPDIEPECLEIVALILGGQNPNVKLYRGMRSSEFFKVEFSEPQEYIPHIVVKNLGLIK